MTATHERKAKTKWIEDNPRLRFKVRCVDGLDRGIEDEIIVILPHGQNRLPRWEVNERLQIVRAPAPCPTQAPEMDGYELGGLPTFEDVDNGDGINDELVTKTEIEEDIDDIVSDCGEEEEVTGHVYMDELPDEEDIASFIECGRSDSVTPPLIETLQSEEHPASIGQERASYGQPHNRGVRALRSRSREYRERRKTLGTDIVDTTPRGRLRLLPADHDHGGSSSSGRGLRSPPHSMRNRPEVIRSEYRVRAPRIPALPPAYERNRQGVEAPRRAGSAPVLDRGRHSGDLGIPALGIREQTAGSIREPAVAPPVEVSGVEVYVLLTKVPVVTMDKSSIFNQHSAWLLQSLLDSSLKAERGSLFVSCDTTEPILVEKVRAECIKRKLARVSSEVEMVRAEKNGYIGYGVGLQGKRSEIFALFVGMILGGLLPDMDMEVQMREVGLLNPFRELMKNVSSLTRVSAHPWR